MKRKWLNRIKNHGAGQDDSTTTFVSKKTRITESNTSTSIPASRHPMQNAMATSTVSGSQLSTATASPPTATPSGHQISSLAIRTTSSSTTLQASQQALPQGPPEPCPNSIPDPSKQDYWQFALDQLQKEDATVWDAAIQIRKAAATSNLDFIQQLQQVTERSRDDMLEKQWKVKLGGRQIVIRAELERLVKVIRFFKDIVNAAGSIDPVHAGLPVAGLCLVMQVATNDSEQYASMVLGVEEIMTIIVRYTQIEVLYLERPHTDLKDAFENKLVSLYKNIIRFQTLAVTYYRRNTAERYLRSIPKLDDLSELMNTIRREDEGCRDIREVFSSLDARDRHKELLEKLEEFKKESAGHGSASPPQSSGKVHWNITRSTNPFFTGRADLLDDIAGEIQSAMTDTARQTQHRLVISGMGGQGKSELCLHVADRVRDLFWGVFWVDVSTHSLAKDGFLETARQIGVPAQSFEEARHGLANAKYPWLLILDNADDPIFDYQVYVPSGQNGVVLMTTRNADCQQYATKAPITLDGLAQDEATTLLLKSACIDPEARGQYAVDAEAVADRLSSHPLALIQAGSYVARGYCSLAEYPKIYAKQRKRLMQFRPNQAKSRYCDVYATFEASAATLKSSSDGAAHDALELLSVFANFGPNRFPLALFEAAWEGAREIASGDLEERIDDLVSWHVSRLPAVIQPNDDEWDSFRLITAVNLLVSFALVTLERVDDGIVSMHPLTHAWAKDRQDLSQQRRSLLHSGCLLALASDESEFLQANQRELRPHLQALIPAQVESFFACGPRDMIAHVLLELGWTLSSIKDHRTLSRLVDGLFSHLHLQPGVVDTKWVSLYELAARSLSGVGKIRDAVQLQEQVVKIYERTLSEGDSTRLLAQDALAAAYRDNGQAVESLALLKQVFKISQQTTTKDDERLLRRQCRLAEAYGRDGQPKEMLALLEQVVKTSEHSLKETNHTRLTAQHTLAGAYMTDGQVEKAVILLERVVNIRELMFVDDYPDRLASQHELARAYNASGQVEQALVLLEHVVRIQERSVVEDHYARLTSQHELAGFYMSNGQLEKALPLMEHVVTIRERSLAEKHPTRLLSQHELARFYMANGQLEKALPLMEHVVTMKAFSLAEDHPSRLASQQVLAGFYEANGQLEKALPLIEHVVKIRERSLPEDNPNRPISQHELAMMYIENGQLKEALALMEHVVKIREHSLAEDNPNRLGSQHAMAQMYTENGQLKEALALMEQVVTIRERSLAENHPERLASQQVLAQIYWEYGKKESALAMLRDVVKIYNRP